MDAPILCLSVDAEQAAAVVAALPHDAPAIVLGLAASAPFAIDLPLVDPRVRRWTELGASEVEAQFDATARFGEVAAMAETAAVSLGPAARDAVALDCFRLPYVINLGHGQLVPLFLLDRLLRRVVPKRLVLPRRTDMPGLIASALAVARSIPVVEWP